MHILEQYHSGMTFGVPASKEQIILMLNAIQLNRFLDFMWTISLTLNWSANFIDL